MGLILNPFTKHDVNDFPGVYESLYEMQRRQQANLVAVSPNTNAGRKSSGSDESTIPGENPQQRNTSSDSTAAERDIEIGQVPAAHYSPYTIEGLRAEIESDFAAGGCDSIYDRKSKIINRAIQDIGMGRYQWQLFCLCGFGWLADNLWLQGVALTLPQLSLEFGVSETNVRYTTCATFAGLCLGACFWGVMSDIIGRRMAFNFTLLLAGTFGLAVGAANTWVGVCGLYAGLGFGVGGNLPVDGALFLEFLPMASSNLLTMLSVWWPVGQLVASLVAWGFVVNYTCSPDNTLPSCFTNPDEACCSRENNMGWRYMNFTLGAMTFVMFVCRFFFFHLFESPKFLLSRGRQAEAVATVHGIAHKNNSKTWLTEEILNEVGGCPEATNDAKLSTGEVIKRTFSKFSKDRIAPLFANRQLALTTVLIWFCWATIGMGYPLFNAFLPQYLAKAGNGQPVSTDVQYRNYAITSVVGVPGSIIACWTVDVKYIGRKGTMAGSTLVTAILLFCFTTSTNSDVQVGLTSLEAFFQNIMYGVLYAYTPEIFPAPNRGTGTGIGSFINRICGLSAPLVAINAGNASPNAPIYASGSLMIAAFLAMCLLPIETRGKQSL